MRFIVLPGNGCTNIMRSNWYGWFAQELMKRNIEVVIKDMPDPLVARENIWIPFIHDTLKVDESTVVIGHSSGACCAMRLLENTRLFGAILVSAAHTDVGDENERASGYFNRPWDFSAMRKNIHPDGFFHQFHSDDDHLIPVEEARFISVELSKVDENFDGSLADYTYEELQNRSHFFDPFSELLRVIDKQIQRLDGREGGPKPDDEARNGEM